MSSLLDLVVEQQDFTFIFEANELQKSHEA
jgi:hypothetical protein